MEIGTPFGTIDFGGIECGNGIGFGGTAGYIGWVYAEKSSKRGSPTSADGEYVSDEDYIFRYTDPQTSELLGYTYEGGDGPYSHIDDAVVATRDLQFKTLDDQYAGTPKDLAIYDISGTFENGRNPLLIETFDNLSNNTTATSGIGDGYSVAYDKQNDVLWVGSSGSSSSMTVLSIDVSDKTNPIITEYLDDELVENPSNGYAAVTSMEYYEGDVFAVVRDFSTSDPVDRVARLTYSSPIQVSQTGPVHVYDGVAIPSDENGGQVSATSNGAYYISETDDTVHAVDTGDMSVNTQLSTSAFRINELVAKGDTGFLRYDTRGIRGVKVLSLGEGLSVSSSTLLEEGSPGLGNLNAGPSSFDEKMVLAGGSNLDNPVLLTLEVGKGEDRLSSL